MTREKSNAYSAIPMTAFPFVPILVVGTTPRNEEKEAGKMRESLCEWMIEIRSK